MGKFIYDNNGCNVSYDDHYDHNNNKSDDTDDDVNNGDANNDHKGETNDNYFNNVD